MGVNMERDTISYVCKCLLLISSTWRYRYRYRSPYGGTKIH